MDRQGAVAVLERAPVVHVASTTPDGAPVLRTVHSVVVDGAVAFHGAPAGEKTETIGREAVISAEEIIAEIPSYFVDPERACPATTYYVSAQVHGRLEEVEDPAAKARVLRGLMEQFQPEGGHVPIDEAHPLYKNAVRGIMVVRMPLTHLDGKAKLGQNRKPEELTKILELLWKRGRPGDPRAIDLVRQVNPAVSTPDFLQAPQGAQLLCALGHERTEEALALLDGTYWNESISRDMVARALLSASAWVGAQDSSGDLVAMARAVSDSKTAWIYDVVVRPDWRQKGLGKAIMRLLLDHPMVRDARKVRLATRDAQGLYERFGFRDIGDVPAAVPNTEMVLVRDGSDRVE